VAAPERTGRRTRQATFAEAVPALDLSGVREGHVGPGRDGPGPAAQVSQVQWRTCKEGWDAAGGRPRQRAADAGGSPPATAGAAPRRTAGSACLDRRLRSVAWFCRNASPEGGDSCRLVTDGVVVEEGGVAASAALWGAT